MVPPFTGARSLMRIMSVVKHFTIKFISFSDEMIIEINVQIQMTETQIIFHLNDSEPLRSLLYPRKFPLR